ncbi:MAG: hypothetical protein PHE88_01460 [Elusimicrobia bacterium]|nr:hypothetical protein [Elusimicrobiota bacterium]
MNILLNHSRIYAVVPYPLHIEEKDNIYTEKYYTTEVIDKIITNKKQNIMLLNNLKKELTRNKQNSENIKVLESNNKQEIIFLVNLKNELIQKQGEEILPLISIKNKAYWVVIGACIVLGIIIILD